MAVNKTVNLIGMDVKEIENLLVSITYNDSIKLIDFKHSAHAEKLIDDEEDYISLIYNDFHTQQVCLESDSVSEKYLISELAIALYDAVVN